MRRALIGLIAVLAAMPAWAQTRDEYIANCESKDVDLSIRGCTGMLQLKPQMTPEFRLAAYFTRAMRYHGKGLEDQAIADFTNAMTLKPGHDTLANLYSGRGMAYYAKSLFVQSIADFSQTIALKPDYADAYKMRGSAYQMKGELDSAIADYRAALKLDPDAQSVKDVLKRLGAAP
jgi:lipoprotein NlpI